MTTLIIRTAAAAAAAAVFATSAATLLALTTTPAAAQEASYDYPQAIVVAKSRAEVKAELLAARAESELFVAEAGYAFGTARSHGAGQPAAAATAEAQPKAKPAARVPAEPNGANFEPQSFDGVITAAGAAVNPLRVN
jgi:hypothetical protein